MQNKWYTIQVLSQADDPLHSLSPSSLHGTCGTHRFLPLGPTKFINWAWCLLMPWDPFCHYGVEDFCWPAWVSCMAMLPPSSCTPAHTPDIGNWKKSLISWQQLKTSLYCQHSSHTKPKTQQLLGRKLTLSQQKPGQGGWLNGERNKCQGARKRKAEGKQDYASIPQHPLRF